MRAEFPLLWLGTLYIYIGFKDVRSLSRVDASNQEVKTVSYLVSSTCMHTCPA